MEGRYDFTIDMETYSKLPMEVKQLLDKNYWRFDNRIFGEGMAFKAMDADEKKLFENETMVIRD